MQFLDAIGLASFWEKIKSWVGKNYLALTGGTVRGALEVKGSFTHIEDDEESQRQVLIDDIGIELSVIDNEDDVTLLTPFGVSSPKFTKNGGTATQVLMANGSIKEVGGKSGIAGLDANGNVPLSQLGNLDTTVAEVVTALPTSNIKRHIYLVKDSDTTNNKYAEYVYTGDVSATYDATKWEKLGDFRADVDLKDYAKKSEAVSYENISVKKVANILDDTKATQQVEVKSVSGGSSKSLIFENASSTMAGFMSSSDKAKLDTISHDSGNFARKDADNYFRGNNIIYEDNYLEFAYFDEENNIHGSSGQIKGSSALVLQITGSTGLALGAGDGINSIFIREDGDVDFTYSPHVADTLYLTNGIIREDLDGSDNEVFNTNGGYTKLEAIPTSVIDALS